MYTLYNPINSNILSNIIDYLHYLGYNLLPKKCIYNKIPVIETNTGEIYVGEKECIQFYTDLTLILHLSDKAREFKIFNPKYLSVNKYKTE